MAPKASVPTVRLRRLAGELTRLRTGAKLTRDDVEARTGVNSVTLYRIEKGLNRPQQRTLVSLLAAYAVPASKQEEMLSWLKDSGAKSWHRSYDDFSEEYATFVGFEREATSIRNFETVLVPGLLQTEEYARALTRGMFPRASVEQVDRRVLGRLERQTVLRRDDPVQFFAILDEAVVSRVVGGPRVMRNQLQHLIDLCLKPWIDLRIVPFAAGGHPGIGAFVIMQFPEEIDPDMVYVETIAGDSFLESQSDVQRYGDAFEDLRSLALDPQESARLLAAACEKMGDLVNEREIDGR